MITGFSRRPYEVKWRLRKDDPTSDITIVMKPAPPGAVPFPFPTPFGNPDTLEGIPWYGLGEVPGTRRYLKETPPPSPYTGQSYKGQADWWRDGIPAGMTIRENIIEIDSEVDVTSEISIQLGTVISSEVGVEVDISADLSVATVLEFEPEVDVETELSATVDFDLGHARTVDVEVDVEAELDIILGPTDLELTPTIEVEVDSEADIDITESEGTELDISPEFDVEIDVTGTYDINESEGMELVLTPEIDIQIDIES